MHKQIKDLAEEALRLQNKDFMDKALREIVAMCDELPAVVAGQAVKAGEAVIAADDVAEPAATNKAANKKGGAK